MRLRGPPEFQQRLPRLIYHRQGAVKSLHAGLSVVERLHIPEPLPVQRLPGHVHMVPTAGVAGAGVPLVEHVQVLEPSTMERIAGTVYVGVFAVLPLDHGIAVLEVS